MPDVAETIALGVEVIGLVGVLLALGLLMILAYRGLSVLLLSPVLAFLAAFTAGDVPLLATYTQVFMPAMGHFIILYFPLFLLGALFGKLMDDSGAALSVANAIIESLGEARALLAVVLACATLTYGGVSLFVVAFAVYPIATQLFRQIDIPKRLIPASIALGAFTFTMTALPGTPAIQNAIPMPYFGTTLFAAPGLGVLAALIMFSGGLVWLQRQAKKARLKGEGYNPDSGSHASSEAEPDPHLDPAGSPHFALSILPIVLVISLNYLFSVHVFPSLNTDYLALALYGSTDLDSVRGIWSIVCALIAAIVVLLLCHLKRLVHLKRTLDKGANSSISPIFNTASLVGFGAVVASLPAFDLIQEAVESIASNPLVSVAISVNLLAGITGSASGGMSIALQTLGDSYLAMAERAAISPELLHRVTTIATGGLDSLPHNGAVVSLLSICGLTHRESYKDIFVVAVACPILALVVVVALGSVLGSF